MSTGLFRPHEAPALRVLSLGAGVQSTTLALMAAHGALGAMPDAAIFADTQAEPQSVYRHLAWLSSANVLPFPVIRVSKGSLRESVLTSTNSTGGRFAAVPFYTRGDGAVKEGRGRRQCTKEFKLEPLWAEMRRLLGVPRGRRVPKGLVVEVWIGISTDEVIRTRFAEHAWQHNRYPLIECGISRADCLAWLRRHEYPTPPKSACTFCPYRHNAEWRRMREEEPEAFADAVAIDAAIRRGGRLRGMRSEQFVHRSCVPLDQADFRAPDPRQLAMGELCEGMCGV